MLKIGDKVIVIEEEAGVFLEEGTLAKVIATNKTSKDSRRKDWDVRICTSDVYLSKRWCNSKYLKKVDE